MENMYICNSRTKGYPWRNIRVKPETIKKLKLLGSKGETYEDIILRLIENKE